MEYYKAHASDAQQQLNTIGIAYPSEQYNQIPVMVELKPIGEDGQTVQLFNIGAVQLSNVHYVTTTTPAAQKVINTCTQTTDHEEYFKREKPCLCTVCGKRYANPKALKKHQVIHPEVVFDWQCRICNKTFPYKITMSRHLKLHAGEKLFKCENCAKRFETRYALVQHVKLHKSDVPFRCQLCDKPFLKSAEYARHIRTHTGEKPFKCNVCGKAFTTRASYVKHSEKKHFGSASDSVS